MWLTSQPHPGVDEPEGDGDRVHDHLSPRSLLALLLQVLETAVQLDELPRKHVHGRENRFYPALEGETLMAHQVMKVKAL